MGRQRIVISLSNARPRGHLIANYNEGPAPAISARGDPIYIHIYIFCMAVRFSILPFDGKPVTHNLKSIGSFRTLYI